MSAPPAKVLVADDEYVVSRCLVHLFKSAGFRCRTAFDGEAALDLLTEETADVVILDIDMPRRDGLDVCRQLRADPRHADAVIVILTGVGQGLTEEGRQRVPADLFLLKPFDPRSLLARVRELLERRARGQPIEVGCQARRLA